MNSSSGFGTGAMGSSAGFKKRNLLRPPSGTLNKRLQFLRSVDISQAEPTIATSIRTQLAAIEEEINLLDKDKRIRQGESGLQKGYVTTLRKWLAGCQGAGQQEEDIAKVLRHMGVDSLEAGFAKLWKVVGVLDLAVSKASELQVIHFLLYDDMFNELGSDSAKSSSALSNISNNGYNPSTFQITQILLDRSKDLYAAAKRNPYPPQKQPSQDTQALIEDLKRENSKLNDLLQQLTKQQEQAPPPPPPQPQPVLVTQPPAQQAPAAGSLSRQAVKQIEEKYEEQINDLSNQKSRAEEEGIELKLKVSSLEAELKALKEADGPGEKHSAKAGSYEEALLQEMEKMKRGFERRIAVLTEEFSGRERELRRREAEYKNQNERIKWEKSLLLRKFDLLSK